MIHLKVNVFFILLLGAWIPFNAAQSEDPVRMAEKLESVGKLEKTVVEIKKTIHILKETIQKLRDELGPEDVEALGQKKTEQKSK